MAVPEWLTTDPSSSPSPNLLSRTRPGWAPRPNRTVKIRSAWEVPGMELGTGQDDEPDAAQQAAQGISVQEYLNRIGGWAAEANVPPESLTSGPSTATVSEETASESQPEATQEPPPASSAADHAPRATSGASAARTAQPQTGVRQSATPTRAAASPPPQGPSSAVRAPSSSTQQRAVPAQTASQQSFTDMAIPAAMKVQDETGIPWQAIVAVSANETGWGKAVAGNNYFGIKGSNPKTGANTGQVGTWEVINGQKVNIQDTFMAFDDYLDSARGFGNFLQSNKRYQPAMSYLQKHPNDWRGFLRIVHDEGYATDPNWSNQVISIGNGLEGKDASVDPNKTSKLGYDKDTQRAGMTDLLDLASESIGSKYTWGGAGGRSSFGAKMAPTDCSGFVAWAYERATGLRLNAQTSSMIKQTSNVRPDQAKPGDLIFFNMGEGANMEHVAIYAGNGMMLHDSSLNPNGGVDITPIWQSQGAQFRRVDGVDPSLYSAAQPSAGLKPKDSDEPDEWAVKVEHGREIMYVYTSDGRVRRQDMGKADRPDGSILGFSGSNAQAKSPEVPNRLQMGTGADESDLDLMRHLGGSPTPSLADLVQPDLGKPYKMAAGRENDMSSDPDDHPAYDCSSFVSSVAGRQGYKLSPFTDRMFDETAPVKPGEEQAGDLIFYRYNDPAQRGVVYPHVGFYLGNGRTYEARFDKATGGGVGEYDQLDPATFKPVYRRMTRPGVGSGQDAPKGSPLEQALQTMIEQAIAKHMGSGQDEDEMFLNPATGNYEPIHKPLIAADNQTVLPDVNAPLPTPEPTQPQPILLDPNRRPINPTAPNRLKPGELVEKQIQTIPEGAKPGEALEHVVGPSAESLGSAASEQVGGLAQAAGGVLGGIAGGIGSTVGGAASALGTTARNAADTAARVPEAVQAVAEHPTETAQDLTSGVAGAAGATGEAIGGASSALGTTVSGIPLPENRSAQDVLDQAGTQPAAKDQLGQGLDVAQQNLTDEYTKMLQDPGQYAHDLSQSASVQQAMPMGAGPLVAMTPGIADSIAWMASNGYDMDHINQAVEDMSHPDPAKRPISAKVAAGGVLSGNPVETLQFLGEGMDAHADLRRAIAVAAQDPAIRDTPEGQAVADGVVMATDPMNLTMLLDPALVAGKAGRIILEGTEPVATRLTGEAAEAAAKGVAKHAPEYADFVRPLTQQETETVLQRAALDLNDQALDDSVKIARGVDRYEPLTGDQVRRQVMNAVARTNPGADAETVLGKTDDILRASGLDLLHSENAGAYGASLGEQIGALREIGLAPEARAADRASLGLGAKQAASVNTQMAIHMGGAAAGGAIGVATEDPDDPNYYGKIASKIGLGLGSTLGVQLAGAYIPRGVSAAIHTRAGAKALEGARAFLAPAMNLTEKAQQWIRVWDGQTQLGHAVGRDFADQVRRTWGKYANLDTLSYIEQTGRLPPAFTTDKSIVYADAQKTLQDWIKITQDFANYGLVPDPLSLGKTSPAKVYVPHVTDQAWRDAITLGKGRAQPGRISTNPFWNYTQERLHQTIAEGQAKGVKYLDEDIPGMLGRYYSAGMRARATSNMVDALETEATVNNMAHYGPTLKKLMLEGEDVVRVPPGEQRPGGATWLGDVPGMGNKYKFEPPDGERTYVSRELADVFGKLFNPEGLADRMGPAGDMVQGVMQFNSALKHNTLSGSAFHLLNEFRQFAATQGFEGIKNLPVIVKNSLFPGEFRATMSDPGWQSLAYDSILNGMSLNTLAEHDVGGVYPRLVTTLMNTAGGAFVGYSTAGAAGLSPEDQAKWALGGAAMGAATTAPGGGALIGSKLAGMETKSLVEAVSEALWNRTIPMMKLTTYAMYEPQVGGRAAAEFANTVFGGNNITAIARSRTVQDILRIGMLAPDWTESWARLIGTSALDTPTGQLARNYWTNAALQSAFLLEGANLALGGHWSWENDPDHVLEVDATNLYERLGHKMVDANGKKFTPYIDVLGPYKGLLQPVIDMGRAATTAAAKQAGVDPMDLPGGPAIAGYFPKPGEPISMAIPAPDPKQKLANFVQARGGAVASNVTQFMDDRDFTGRPLDRNGDEWYQSILNRVNAAAPHVLPTGVAQVIRSGVYGEPWEVTAGSALTGMRVTHSTEAQRFFDMQDEYIKEVGKSQKDWQAIQEDNKNANRINDRDKAALINEQAMPDLTYGDRGKQISDLISKHETVSASRENQIPDTLQLTDPTSDQRLRSEIQWLSEQNVSHGTNAPADQDPKSVGLSQAEILRMAWNRDPQLVERLQAGGRRGIASEPGRTAQDDLAKQRDTWTADVANKYDLDLNVVQDIVKASLYGEKGNMPPPIPGVTSGQLDDIIREYGKRGRDAQGNDLDPTKAQQAKSQYLSDTVNALNANNPGGPQLDQANLLRRINLRKLPLADQTPQMTDYDRAQEVRQRAGMYNYVNPDGTPMGDANQWATWDQELKEANNKQQRFNGIYTKRNQYGDDVPDEHLNQISDARTQAIAQRMKTVLRDPNLTPAQRDAYFKWYGEGSTLTPDQWKQFQNGTLDMYSDASKFPGGKLPKDEWDARVKAVRLYNSLTKQERIDYDDQNKPNPRPLIQWQGQTDPRGPIVWHQGTLKEYMTYLGYVRNAKYSGLKLDQSEPDTVPSGG